MTEEEETERVRKILAAGGSIFMHKNDFERVEQAVKSDPALNIFEGAKIHVDRSGGIEEGSSIAAIVGKYP